MIAANPDLVVVLGPTASGKTRLAVSLASLMGSEIISADSRQVYRGLDIGSGKDLEEYGAVPYHLIDIVDPDDEFNVFEYQRRFNECFSALIARGVTPIMVGGSGLYIEAVLSKYHLQEVPTNPALRSELDGTATDQLAERLKLVRPNQHNTTDLNDRDRLIRAIEIAEGQGPHPATTPDPALDHGPSRPAILGIRLPRDVVRERITTRLKSRLDEGLIEEVRGLLDQGIPSVKLEYFGLEYRYVCRYLTGELNRNDMFQKLNSAIHQFAKRQETWFRRMEKRGMPIHWLDGLAAPLEEAKSLLKINALS